MSKKRDYYEILGVDRNATKDEIKRAFRKKAMEFHPDRNKNPGAEEKFKEINEAYEVLGDDEKRAKYDRFGHAAFDGNAGFGSTTFDFSSIFEDIGEGFGSIFEDFFGGGFRSNRPRKGSDLQVEIKISFLDSFFGTKIKKTFKKWDGNYQVSKDEEIDIPPGIKNNDVLVLRGYGEQGINGGSNGDLYLIINITNHKHYIRDNLDLHIKVPVSIFDVATEKDILVPHPNGFQKVNLGSIKNSSETIKLKNKGFKHTRHHIVGSYIIHFEFYVPYIDKKTKKDVLSNIQGDYQYKKFLEDFQ